MVRNPAPIIASRKDCIEILNETGVTGGNMFVCTGSNYADALSASAYGYPILLVGKKLTRDQKAFLKNGQWSFTIIGGTAAVSTDIEEQLKSYGEIEDRIAGKNRYDTSKLLAEKYAYFARSIVMATGNNFPDGLCGGPVAYSIGAPIILTSTGYSASFGKKYTTTRKIKIGLVLGGTDAVTDDVVRDTFGLGKTGTIVRY